MAKRLKPVEGSLCWICKKAGYECNKPIEGWDAWYNPILNHNGALVPSWMVYSCPEFEQERFDIEYIPPKKDPTKQGRLGPTDKSKLLHYDIFGEALTASEIRKRYGVKTSTFRTRLMRGMTPSQAVIGSRTILKATNFFTEEKREWLRPEDACNDIPGCTNKGIHESMQNHTVYKGWIFTEYPIKEDNYELRRY